VTWYALHVAPPASQRDAITAALFDAGAPGLQEDGANLIAHFPSAEKAESALRHTRMVVPDVCASIREVSDTDWTRAWRDQLRAFPLGALTIAPPWLADGLDPSGTVVIDPGMAFGTGDHATTRGAIRLLQTGLRPRDVVADLGTGSAVIAIAAAKLGARRVVAIEVDPDALGNARENIERNAVASRVDLLEGDARTLLSLVAPFDVIVANILAPVVIELLPVMAASLTGGGRAIIAGILDEEHSGVLEAAGAGGWRVERVDVEEGWWSALLTQA
jgi:ribosomal protein L11 methyltransferase